MKHTDKPERNGIFINTLFTVGLRWADRIIGLVSTIILARILAPEDFGVIAMASLVVTLVDIIFNLGVHVPLIQKSDVTQSHYDTAWTLKIIQATLATTLIALSAPYAASYFAEERITLVIQLIGFHILLTGLENIGVVNFQKEMNFALDFKFRFTKRLISFLITITAAWLLQTYWALVIGTLASSAIGTILSYSMHPMRPKLRLEKVDDIFFTSQWVLLNNIGSFLNHRLHHILVGKTGDTTTMGGYSLANQVAEMPSVELLAPINRVLFPAFSINKENPVELKRLFLLAQGVQSIIAVPASVGLYLVAPEIVQIMLGEKWLFIIPVLQLLALANISSAITTSATQVMFAKGQFKQLTTITWVRALSFLLLFVSLTPSSSYDIAQLYLASVVIGFFLIIWRAIKALQTVSLTEMAATTFRPVIASAAMYYCVINFTQSFNFGSLEMLTIKVIAGVSIYSVLLILLWFISGQPDAAEKFMLEKLKEKRKKNKS